MLILEILMVIFSVAGSLLNARMSKYGMLCWIIADTIGIPFFIILEKYYMVGLYIFWTATSLYGYWYWGQNKHEKQ